MKNLSRQDFLKVTGASLAGITLGVGCGDFGGQQSGAGSGGPQLSSAPQVEGEVITENLGEHTITVGMGLSDTSPTFIAMEYFKEIVEQRTEERITVNISHSSQLGSDNERIDAVQNGNQEMDLPDASPLFSQIPEIGIFDLPYLFPNPETAYRVLDGDIGEELKQAFEGTNMRALFFAENGFRHLTNNAGVVRSPEDAQGLSVRVRENPIQVDLWEAIGANPNTLAFGELYSALEQGVSEGQENPWNTIYSSNFYEVQQYASETNHVYSALPVIFSEQIWNELHPRYQELIQEAVEQSGQYQRQISQEYTDYAKQQVQESDTEVTELNDEQLQAFREVTEPIYEQWSPEIGESLVQRTRQAVAESEG